MRMIRGILLVSSQDLVTHCDPYFDFRNERGGAVRERDESELNQREDKGEQGRLTGTPILSVESLDRSLLLP